MAQFRRWPALQRNVVWKCTEKLALLSSVPAPARSFHLHVVRKPCAAISSSSSAVVLRAPDKRTARSLVNAVRPENHRGRAPDLPDTVQLVKSVLYRSSTRST